MANLKISEMTSADPMDGTELVEIVQADTNKKSLTSSFLQYVEENITLDGKLLGGETF